MLLCGPDCSFRNSLIERFIRSEARVVIDGEVPQAALIRLKNELEFTGAELISLGECDSSSIDYTILLGQQGPIHGQSISVALQQKTPTQQADCTITVSDMIPAGTSGQVTPSEILAWYDQLESSNPVELANGPYWWVSEHDVADGIARMVLHGVELPSKASISGRKEWTAQASFDEFSMLYKRTVAGKSGMFGVEHLTAAPTPKITVEKLWVKPVMPLSEEENRKQRPDLAPIHDALVAADGDGWRPLTPIRTAMMYFLAAALE